jgi:nicotinamide riboside kinase
MRIALLGASSTGKTFMARKLEEILGVLYLAYQTRDWMAECGYSSHSEVHAAGPQKCMEFQKGLARKRDELFRSAPELFVTDRCTLDNLVYYWVDDAKSDTAEGSAEFRSFCVDSFLSAFDVAVLFDFGVIPFKEDGQRVGNPMYHELTQLVYERVFTEVAARAPHKCHRLSPFLVSPADRMSAILGLVDRASVTVNGQEFFGGGCFDAVREHDYGV